MYFNFIPNFSSWKVLREDTWHGYPPLRLDEGYTPANSKVRFPAFYELAKTPILCRCIDLKDLLNIKRLSMQFMYVHDLLLHSSHLVQLKVSKCPASTFILR